MIDWSVFGNKEIRDVLKSKAHCLHAGFSPDHVIITTFNEIRDHYIQSMGLPTYLSQMLGQWSMAPMRCVALYGDDGHRLSVNGKDQTAQQFIAKLGRPLPFKVEIHCGRVEVRYL